MIRPNLQTGFRTRKRATALKATLDKNLSAYATAATAAGMGMLMSALPVEAKIVHTPSNIPIPVNAGTILLDLNHDGIPDFGFNNAYSFGGIRRGEGYHAERSRGFSSSKEQCDLGSHKPQRALCGCIAKRNASRT